jgi:lambda family phage portal protein
MNPFKRLLGGLMSGDVTWATSSGRAGSGGPIHDAAYQSRSRQNLTSTPQDSRIDVTRMSRQTLMAKARALAANDGLTRGAIADKTRYSVGRGLIPQARTANQEWNTKAEDYWRQWCKIADVSGRYNFNRIQRIISKAVDRDGDIGVVMVKTPNGFPQVQLVEAHRIGDPGLDTPALPTGPDGSYWQDGVLLSEAGSPLAYSVISVNPLGQKTRTVVPASNFIHVFDGERADQARGFTALYHAITTIQDKKEIIELERKGVKLHSAIAAVLRAKSSSLADDWKDGEGDSEGGTNPDGTPEKLSLMKVLDGGEIPVIGQQDNLDLTRSDRPSPAFTGFLEFLIRDIANGLGLPYEFVWNPEKLGGTAQRFVLEKAQRTFRERQDLISEVVLDRLWFWVISSAIKRGELDYIDGAWNVRWQLPAEITVDAGRDANADREDVKMGLMTEAEHFGRRGLDWLEEREQRHREVDDLLTRAQDVAKKFNVTLDYAAQLLQQSAPNIPPAKPPVAPKPGSNPDQPQANQNPKNQGTK